MQQFFDIFQTFGKLNKITKIRKKNGAILTKKPKSFLCTLILFVILSAA